MNKTIPHDYAPLCHNCNCPTKMKAYIVHKVICIYFDNLCHNCLEAQYVHNVLLSRFSRFCRFVRRVFHEPSAVAY